MVMQRAVLWRSKNEYGVHKRDAMIAIGSLDYPPAFADVPCYEIALNYQTYLTNFS